MPSRTSVGMVLDAGVLQVVELTTEAGRVSVVRAICEKLPAAAFKDGELTDANAAADAVRHVFRSYRISCRGVSLALGGRLAIARVVEVAEANAAEAENVLQDRIARYAIYENREVLWKAAPLEGEGEQKRVYLVASAAQANVNALLLALRRAGIYVTRIEPYVMAVMRSLAGCLGEDERPTVLVALRNESADFVIVRGAKPLLIRSIEEGMESLVKRPQAFEDLLTEARRALEFCGARAPNVKPRLWLSQSASENADAAIAFLARLKDAIPDVEVEAVPPWPAAITAAGARQAWAAVGTAMADLAGHETVPHLNLVPPEWPELERVQKQFLQVVSSIGAAVLLTLGVSMGIRFTTHTTAKQAQAASVQMEANTVDVKRAAELKHQAAEAVAKVSLWKDVRNEVKPLEWAAAIGKVLAQVPEGVRVQQINFRRGTVRVIGEARSIDLVHQMVQRLGRMPDLEEASIERLVQPTGRGPGSQWPGYTIVCRFKEQAPAAGPATPTPAPTAQGAKP